MRSDVLEQLRRFDPDEHLVLSVTINVPIDPAAARGTRARLKELTDPLRARIVDLPHAVAESLRADLDAIVDAGEQIGEQPGATLAIFRCSARDLDEQVVLPTQTTEIAVAEPRPYLRALDAALGERERIALVLVDRRHALISELADDRITLLSEVIDETERSEAHGGWYGLDEHNTRQHASEEAKRHLKAIAQQLSELHAREAFDAVILAGQAGHGEDLRPFLDAPLASSVCGSIVVDASAASHADLLEACRPLLEERRRNGDLELLRAVSERHHRAESVLGLTEVAEAVNVAAIDTLLVVPAASAPGGVCDGCCVIVLEGTSCTSCEQPVRRTDDVIGAIVDQTLRTGGRVRHLADLDAQPVQPVSALLRFPLPAAAATTIRSEA